MSLQININRRFISRKIKYIIKIFKRWIWPKFKSDSRCRIRYQKIEIQKKKVKIQIWDTAGQERYRSITSAYYKGAKGAFIVYDITRKNTFDNIDKWVSDLKINGDKNIAIILIGNKSDLEDKREVQKEEGIKKSEEYKTAFMETSALNGDNINKAFEELIEQIYQNNCTIIEEEKKWKLVKELI